MSPSSPSSPRSPPECGFRSFIPADADVRKFPKRSFQPPRDHNQFRSLNGHGNESAADMCSPSHFSKGKTKTEMERAEIFLRVRVGIDSLVKSNRADRYFNTQLLA